MRSQARPALESTQEALREGLGHAQTALTETDRRVRTFVAEQPLLAIGAALLAGYTLARLLPRR